jgi:hypothetical protein
MSVVGVRGDYLVNTTPSWLFAGTKLRNGDVIDLAIGNEVDAQEVCGPAGSHDSAQLTWRRSRSGPTRSKRRC